MRPDWVQFPAPRLKLAIGVWTLVIRKDIFQIETMSICKNILLCVKKDKILFFSVILTLPSILIWCAGGISYVWSVIYKYLIVGLSVKWHLFILLILPFAALNLALLSYIKTKSSVSKKIFLLNLFFIILVTAASVLI